MKYVLIDLSYLAYKAMYACGDLEHEDIPTGVLYGFFSQLYGICTNPPVNSNKVLIFADSRKSYRKRIFPEYKERRHEQRTEEEQEKIMIMYKQVNKLKNKILPKLGFPVFKQVGLESDDLIAWAAKEITRRKKQGIIITSDGDLYQCITPYVKWYQPGRIVDSPGGLFMDEDTFQETREIKANLWGIMKSLAGCTSDCVPGLKGVGKKGAIKFLKGELPKHHKQYQTIIKNKKEIKKWGKLTILPHKKTKPFKIYRPEYKSKLFFSFCKHYNIMSYLEPAKRAQWIKFFKGDFKRKIKRRRHGKRKLI